MSRLLRHCLSPLQRLLAALLMSVLLSGCLANNGEVTQPMPLSATSSAVSAASDSSAASAKAAAPASTLPLSYLDEGGTVPVTPQDLPTLPVPPVSAGANVEVGAEKMAYAALGDSLTAGVQSAGLTAAGQYAAYPSVVARLTDVRFGVPATRLGCPVPMGGGLQPGSCERVVAGVHGSNFAIPGARVRDLYTTRGSETDSDLARRIYGLILGPSQTQVEAAVKSQPSYLTLWIGSNDALTAVTEGDPNLVTPPEEFETHYRRVLEALRPTGAKMLLLTVPDVTRVPLMSTGAVLFDKGVAEADCQGSENRLPLTAFLIGQRLSCQTPAALTPEETVTIQATVQAYNAAIYRLGAEFGYDVLAVQPMMDQLDMHPATDETSPAPFGADMSADGIHPSNTGQLKLGYALTEYVSRHWGIGLPAATQQELAAANIRVGE